MVYKAALFDLDGVILDTESQYSVFWGGIGKDFYPEVKNFCDLIKGQTLVQIYAKWFDHELEKQAEITRRLNLFEESMSYTFIPGAHAYIRNLHSQGVPMAIVTSSNDDKMKQVFAKLPDIVNLFDTILTSEHFSASKPDPDCYLKGASYFGVAPSECVVFEDSINGLKAAQAAGTFVVGLATTNSATMIKPFADIIIPDFTASVPQLFNIASDEQ